MLTGNRTDFPTQNISGIVIGSGFFANLRPFRHYSERVCFVTSMLSNTKLAGLLVCEKNEVMKPYSRVLLINVAFDYFYTVVSVLVEMELEMNDGVYIFVINGIPKDFSPSLQHFAIWVFMFATASSIMVAPIEFIFRYFLVVRNYALRLWQLFAMAGFVALMAVLGPTLLYLAVVSENNDTNDRLMSHSMWQNEDGHVALFYGAERGNIYMIMFFVFATIQDMLVGAILLFTTHATLASLNENRRFMSTKVRYMQSQLNRLMFAEVLSLASVAVIPMALILVFLVLRVTFVGFGLLITVMLQWIPAVNPITTFLLVGPYRRKLVGAVWGIKRASSALTSTSNSATRMAGIA